MVHAAVIRHGMRMALLAVLTAGSAHPAQGEIQWFKNLDEAVAVAQEKNQPILIDFYADWCGPCKIMDAEVYTRAELIAAFNQKMIGVRIHFDLQPEMVRKYNVPALPYLVFTNSLGTELLHHRGLLESEDMIAVIRAFPADMAELNRLDRILRKDKNHFPALRQLGDRLREMGFYEASRTYYERALQHDEARRSAAQREEILYFKALNSLALQDGKTAASALERCLREFSKSPRQAEMLFHLGQAYAMDGKKDRARKSLSAVIAEFPHSESAERARALLESL